jgi:transposase
MPPSIVRAVSMLRSSPTPEGRRCHIMGHVTGCHMELPKAATPTRDLPADRPPWHRVQSAAGPSSLEVERSLAWLLANRRLTVRYERHADLLTAFLHLACALICARKLRPL